MANHPNSSYRNEPDQSSRPGSSTHTETGPTIISAVAEFLERHFQEMVATGGNGSEATATTVVEGMAMPTEQIALIKLAEKIYQVIIPAQPSTHFRSELHQALVDEHRRRSVQRTFLSRLSPEELPPWWWRVAATAPVLLGIVAYLWHRNNRPVENRPRFGIGA
jgi:hypothetical protein